MLRAALLVALLATTACAAEMDDRPASWSYIHAAIIVPNCATASCHSTLTRTAGIDFEDREAAYDNWVGFLLGLEILKGDRRDRPRMPPDQPLPDADIALIQRWLDAGFPEN